MKNRQFHKFLKTKKKNSGFTLIELLTGLIMSIFVTGALGFGLYQILRTTGKESSKVSARNEASRAMEFVADEIRRASTIDGDLLADLDDDGTIDDVTAPNFSNSSNDKTVVLALEIPEVSSSQEVDNDGDADSSDAAMLGSDDNAATPERIVYYLKSSSGTNWQGPLVLYRWGPPLNADGEYTQNAWTEEALIDGIDDTTISNACASVGGIQTPTTAQGFYACIQDDDRDGITEDGTTDTNGDTLVDARDDDDVDGVGKSAQLFLTGGIYANKDEADSYNAGETYTADTKVAARAKIANVSSSEDDEDSGTNFQTLKADYDCRYIDHPAIDGFLLGIPWTIRLDFNRNDLSSIDLDDSDPNTNYTSSELAAYNDTTPWIHKPNRKSQPINVSADNDLTITASAVGQSGCNSRGNPDTDGTEQLSEYDATIDTNYTMKLNNASGNDADGNPNWYSFNGGSAKDADGNPLYDNPDVNGDGTVLVLKEGSTITAELTPSGFTATENGLIALEGQKSIGDFLESEDYAIKNLDGTYTIVKQGEHPEYPGDMTKGLAPNQRILAFELGHTEKYLNNDPTQPNPGFDVNDAVFIMTNDKFEEEYATP